MSTRLPHHKQTSINHNKGIAPLKKHIESKAENDDGSALANPFISKFTLEESPTTSSIKAKGEAPVGFISSGKSSQETLDGEDSMLTATLTANPRMAQFFRRMLDTERAFYFLDKSAQGDTNKRVKLVSSDFYDNDEVLFEAFRDSDTGKQLLLSMQSRKTAEKDLKDEETQKGERELSSSDLSGKAKDAFEKLRANNEKHKKDWYHCCKLEYIKRQQMFNFISKKRTTLKLPFVIIAIILIVMPLLYAYLPVWELLLDIETNRYYATLGIPITSSPAEVRKAYRQLTKEWHPDRHPEHRQRGRDTFMKIQEAYDHLIKKGVDEQVATAHQRQQYKEALLHLRSLIFFKVYSIAFYCSEYVNMLVLESMNFFYQLTNQFHTTKQESNLLLDYRDTIELFIRITTVMLFVTSEVIFVTGMDIVVVIQAFYFVITMVQSSKKKKDIESISKRSYFDQRKDFWIFVLPCVMIHLVYFYFFEKYPQTDVFLFQLLIGFAYITAHLAKFTPNLFDNYLLRKCSISIPYLRQVMNPHNGRISLEYSIFNLISAEFDFLLGDLFAFTSNVSSIFRISVLFIHSVYLIQRHFYPWDAPITGKLARHFQSTQEKNKKRILPLSSNVLEQERRSCHNNNNDKKNTQTVVYSEIYRSGEEEGNQNHKKMVLDKIAIVQSPWHRDYVPTSKLKLLTDKERKHFIALDRECPSWLSIADAKYMPNIITQGRKDTFLGLLVDFKRICVVKSTGSPEAPSMTIMETYNDPAIAALMYRAVGERAILPPVVDGATGSTRIRLGGNHVVSQAECKRLAEKGAYENLGGKEGLALLSNNELRTVSLARGMCVGEEEYNMNNLEGVISWRNKKMVFSMIEKKEDDGLKKEKTERFSSSFTVTYPFMKFCYIISVLFLFLMVGLYSLPNTTHPLTHQQSYISKSSSAKSSFRPSIFANVSLCHAFDPWLVPICPYKYYEFLPPEHPLNAVTLARGMFMTPIKAYDGTLPVPVMLPDFWEALRHMASKEGLEALLGEI